MLLPEFCGLKAKALAQSNKVAGENSQTRSRKILMIGIFGAGVVGSRVAESLSGDPQTPIAVYDSSQVVAQRLARRLHETNGLIQATSRT